MPIRVPIDAQDDREESFRSLSVIPSFEFQDEDDKTFSKPELNLASGNTGIEQQPE
jgi:hypothetical protein